MPGKHSAFKLRSGNTPSPVKFFRGAKTNQAARQQHSFRAKDSYEPIENTETNQPEYTSTSGSNNYDQQNIDAYSSEPISRFRTKDWARQDKVDESKEFRQSQVDAAMRHNPNLMSDLKKKFGSFRQAPAYDDSTEESKNHLNQIKQNASANWAKAWEGSSKPFFSGMDSSKPMIDSRQAALLRKWGLMK